MIIMNFTKMFDKVPHCSILHKHLNTLGFIRVVVYIYGISSSSVQVISDVLVLGQILFIVYINVFFP